jgi:hypothetical protein
MQVIITLRLNNYTVETKNERKCINIDEILYESLIYYSIYINIIWNIIQKLIRNSNIFPNKLVPHLGLKKWRNYIDFASIKSDGLPP